jgi:hypothetical protein
MQSQPFEVGDVVHWHYPPHQDYCVSWAREYGPGPFEVTWNEDGLRIKPLAGEPTAYLSARAYPFNPQIFRCDQFLTAVHKALKTHAK